MKISKFLKDLLTTGFTQVGVLLSGVLVLKIMAGILNQDNFGMFMLIRKYVVALLPMVTLNLSLGLARYVGFDKEKAGFYLRIALIITTALSFLIIIFFTFFNKIFSITFFSSAQYGKFVFVLAVFLGANVVHLIIYSYFRGKLNMNAANGLRLLFAGFPVLLGVILVLSPIKNQWTVLYLYFLIYSFWAVVTSLIFLKRGVAPMTHNGGGNAKKPVERKVWRKSKVSEGHIKNRLSLIFKECRGLFTFSLTRVPSLIFISLVFGLPAFIAAHRISLKAAGHMGIVVAVIQLLAIFSMPFSLIFLPKFSSLKKNEETANIKKYSLIVLNFIFTFLPIVVVIVFGLTRFIILIWFGSTYLNTVNGVSAAILASVFYLGFALIRGILDGLYVFPFTNIINFSGFITILVLSLLLGANIFELSIAFSCGLFMLGMVSFIVLIKKLCLSIRWFDALKTLIGSVIIFFILKYADGFFTGLNLNSFFTFAAYVSYRAVLLFLVWLFYWRKTIWYGEVKKRITFKGALKTKEDVIVYED
jgi:O-antigen/teichoic acid export membrane protein